MFRRLVAVAACAAIVAVLRAQAPPDVSSAIDQRLHDADAALVAGRFDAMADAAEAAVALSRPSGDRPRLAQSLYKLGQARFYQSKNDEARAAFEEALDLATALGDAALRARAVNGVGLALRELGDYDRALDFLQRALDENRALGNRPEQARVQRNIAVLYWHLGDLPRAETTARAAADLARELGDKTLEAITLQAYGSIVADAGRPREALRIDRRSLAIAETAQVPALLIEPHVSIGDALAALGDRDAALGEFQTALALSKDAAYTVGQAVAMAEIGETERGLGRAAEALDWMLRARALFATLGPTMHSANVLANEFQIAEALQDEHRTDEALATYRAAIDMLDRIRRAAVPTEAATASVNAARSALFRDAAALLIERDRTADAFAIAERYHARAFLDQFAASRVDVERAFSVEERDRQRALLAQAVRIQNDLWSDGVPRDRRRRLEADLAAVDAEFERISGGVRRRSASYAVHYPTLLDATAVQTALLDDGDVLLEFVLGEPTSIAVAVSRRGVQAATLGGRAQLTPLVERYRAAISTPVSHLTLARAGAEADRAAAALYAALIAPLEPALAGATRLIVVADGPLAAVPFEPLAPGRADSSRTIGDRFAVEYAPSASALHAIETADRGGRPPLDLFAVGDPQSTTASTGSPLPFSLEEVRAIGAVFPTARRRLLLGADATERAVKQAPLGDYRFLHFATHGVLDALNPGRSGLVLARAPHDADDGMLQAREIQQLPLRADMVTLSACETGLGRVVSGEGVLGLPRAFFYAGARSVVVSLWNVNDSATEELMRAFYARVRRGEDRSRALAAAKRALARGGQPLWRHPYYWAPFVFVGSSRDR